MQRNGFIYAVETNHGDHPKQCISETWEGSGILSTWSMGVCLPCWRGSISGSSTKGAASCSGSTSTRQTKHEVAINMNAMLKHMIEGWNLMYNFWCVRQFHLNGVYCIWNANSNPHLNSTWLIWICLNNLNHIQMCMICLWSVVELHHNSMVQIAKAFGLNLN